MLLQLFHSLGGKQVNTVVLCMAATQATAKGKSMRGGEKKGSGTICTGGGGMVKLSFCHYQVAAITRSRAINAVIYPNIACLQKGSTGQSTVSENVKQNVPMLVYFQLPAISMRCFASEGL